MAEVGGMLASGVLQMVAGQIGSAIGDQITLQWNFNDDLQGMKMTLESVQEVLKDAETQSTTNGEVRLWLKRLKNSMYDISDMIDEYEANAKPPARKLAARIPRLTIVPKISMANKMKKMRAELEKITKQHMNFSFTTGSSSNVQQVTDTRETSSNVEEARIIGRTKDKQKIMASLSGSITQEITILPIYGIGGIGKTTLAKLVFNDTQFKDYSRVWVYVSQTFDSNKIGNSIVSQVSEEQSQMTEKEMIHKRLGKVLAGKKILIVLDDLWEKDPSKLDELKSMLKVGEGVEVVVIITTRDEGIAKKIRSVEPYKIEPLTNDTCWTIIKHKSAFDARPDKEQLELIGREIAKKCGGVALAAQSIGYTLQHMTSDEWESVKNSDIWNVLASENESSPHHVPASLKLSYSSMPPYLKLCFAYCAIFPKGHNIDKDDLIHQWISLGFIETVSILSTRQLGENYVSHLLGMSFLQHSKSPLTEAVTLFTMHDLVHDLARSVMADEVLDASKKGNIGGNCCRYALLADRSKPLNLSVTSAKIRALRFIYSSGIEFRDAAFSSAKHLRVLDLSECRIRKLPRSIARLKQLRYLNAPRILDPSFPKCITKLSKLNYLNLRGSEISTLPESIGGMEGLIYLDLSCCSRIKKLPKSFVELKDLVHLDLSCCRQVEEGIPEALGALTKLQYLNLSHCGVGLHLRGLPEALGALTKLQYLNLSHCGVGLHLRGLPEALGALTKLQYLNLSHCGVGLHLRGLPEALGALTKLQYLNLSHCGVGLHLRGLPEALGALTKLQYLNLSHCGDELHLRGLPEVIVSLTKLQYLNLSHCINLSTEEYDSFIDRISTLSNLEHLDLSYSEHLVSIPESVGKLKKLRTLDLSWCVRLARLPESLAKMDSLKALIAKGCFELPHFMVHAVDGQSRSNLNLLQHANPHELKISRLENVKSAQEAQSIKLMEKQRIKELEFWWTRGAERFVEDMEVLGELVPPSTLERFEIQGYNSVSFPAWLIGISHYLPNIKSIVMYYLPRCCNLPPLGQLPNLRELVLWSMDSVTKIDERFCGGARAFPRLEIFELKSMKRLKEWNTTYSYGEVGVCEFMFPNLERLEICWCPKLRLKPCPPRATESWQIWDSDEVISSWAEDVSHTGASSSSALVKQLVVESCEVPLHQWRLLHHLPDVHGLTISRCSDLTSSPEIIRDLSSLESLTLVSNGEAELPKWLGELTSLQQLEIRDYSELQESQEIIRQLTSLQQLRLSNCKSMTSQPHWLGELTSLKELEILGCEGIKSLPESIRQLTSLKKLEIRSCGDIKSLPESIRQLTNLEELRIIGCPELKRWCEAKENQKTLVHIQTKYIRGW